MSTQPKQTLFNISEEIMLILADVEDAEGEITDEQVQRLVSLGVDLDKKVDNTLLYCEELETRASALKAEATALTGRANMFTNERERLRTLLMKTLDAVGKRKIKTDRFTVTVSDKKDMVYAVEDIPDEWKLARLKVPVNEIPPEMQQYVEHVDLNKSGIRAALKSQDIAGVSEKINGTKITVRR